MFTTVKSNILRRIEPLKMRSLDQASIEQNFDVLKKRLAGIVPDLSGQYTLTAVNDLYTINKVRSLHAFQISLVEKVLNEFKAPTIVDIGDSAGTHIQYLNGLFSNGRKLNCLSVNLDPRAIERIKSKGLQALHLRAEELVTQDIHADIFLCFETLEHIMDPCQFLHDLSMKTKAQYLIVTVPYVKKSRMGLRQIRKNIQGNHYAENTHIFELSPRDWKLLFQFSGWKIKHEKIFYQYPQRHWLKLLKYYWRRCDFEGFYGVILTPDQTWSSTYKDW